ncbi:hypothetical protein BP6252_02791 [Coleophoma cylindrospora]|uniref:Acyltransferase 3 domain-containing protein n=1 Tax=Coleophoma cylindrospora TaxID=1849047 RepID=A0A3D8SG87_9HELO|nr:hypothetical protein BP6252_02791 [Coleophoma cylindrospora]
MSSTAKYLILEWMRMAYTSAPTVHRSFLAALKPSFLGRRHLKPRTLYPTSYLDGLRGVAALFVVFNHYVAQYFPYLSHGWGSGDGSNAAQGKNDRIIQLPILRTVYSGRFMVTIFFVISGYVLSHKALGLARRRDLAAVLQSLSSSVFRRWLRLMLPALASTIIGLVLARTGLAHNLYSDWDTLSAAGPPTTGRVIVEAKLPEPKDATFSSWIEDCLIMVDPFQFGNFKFPTYNFPLWTMQVEYMGSMIVFTLVLGIVLVRPKYRIAIPSMLVAFCLFTGRWQWTLFISGVLLAELSHGNSVQYDLLLDASTEDVTEKPTERFPSSIRRVIFSYVPYSIGFILACYLGTYPEYGADSSPGYRLLSFSGVDPSSGYLGAWEIPPKDIHDPHSSVPWRYQLVDVYAAYPSGTESRKLAGSKVFESDQWVWSPGLPCGNDHRSVVLCNRDSLGI